MEQDLISIQLTQAEALVLEAFLESHEQAISFQQEEPFNKMVLYRLHAQVEYKLPALNDPAYDQLLQLARNELADKYQQ